MTTRNQTTGKPIRISVADLEARIQAGEVASLFDVRNQSEWDRSDQKIPGASAPGRGDRARSGLVQGSVTGRLLNLTAGSGQRPCGAPAPRPGLHGSLRPARWFRCMAIGWLPGRAKGILAGVGTNRHAEPSPHAVMRTHP